MILRVKFTLMDFRLFFRSILNPWVIFGAVAIGLLLLASTIIFVGMTRPGTVSIEPGTAVVNMISAPTDTPVPPTGTANIEPTQPPSVDGLFVGADVIISGTGGDGLRLRFTPGLDGKVRILGAEGEAFQIKDGPEESDGYVWWYLESKADAQRRGWAVANFLKLADAP